MRAQAHFKRPYKTSSTLYFITIRYLIVFYMEVFYLGSDKYKIRHTFLIFFENTFFRTLVPDGFFEVVCRVRVAYFKE